MSNIKSASQFRSFFATQLITQEWAEPIDAEHLLYRAVSDVKDADGHVLITAYALHRPDGLWSLMIINKDYDHAHQVRIAFRDAAANRESSFSGKVEVVTFGKEQYQWHSNRKKGFADPDGPPNTSTLQVEQHNNYFIPPASVTVIRGTLGSAH